MEGIKSILTSTTFWGAVTAGAGGLLSMLHYGGFDIVGMTADMVALFTGVFATIGSGIAVYGRIKAVKKIG
jgi:hypothetical protein